jgi:hypothetical protein
VRSLPGPSDVGAAGHTQADATLIGFMDSGAFYLAATIAANGRAVARGRPAGCGRAPCRWCTPRTVLRNWVAQSRRVRRNAMRLNLGIQWSAQQGVGLGTS